MPSLELEVEWSKKNSEAKTYVQWQWSQKASADLSNYFISTKTAA